VRFALGAAGPFLGGAQMAANLNDRLYALTGIPFRPGEAMNEYLARLEELKQSGRKKLGSEGFDFTEAAGTVLSPLFLKGAQSLKAAPTVAGRIGQSTAIGTAGGLTAPVTDGGEDYWTTKGGQALIGTVLGAVAGGATELVRGAAKLGAKVLEPATDKGRAAILKRYREGLVGEAKPDVVRALENAPEIVPGSRPTAAEAVSDIPAASPLAAHQRAVAATPEASGAFVARDRAQEAARLAAIRSVGQDKAAVKAAEATRASNAAVNYGAARQQGAVKSDATLEVLLKRPSMDKALARASELAAEADQPFVVAATPATRTPSRILTPQGTPARTTVTAEKPAEYPVTSLHHIKTAMDDLLRNPERFGIGASEARAMEGTRRLYINWLEQKVPAYKTARTTFSADSVPINQMQVGQQLEQALASPVPGAAERAAGFAQAVRNAPGTIKKATGQPRFEELSEVLSPGQEGAVRNVVADLGRSARAEQLARATNLPGGASIVEGKSGPHLPNLLSRPAMITNFIMRKLGEGADVKINRAAGEQYLNPQKLADALKDLPPAMRRTVLADLMRMGRVPTIGGGAAIASEPRE
jgi:hypothetical protein